MQSKTEDLSETKLWTPKPPSYKFLEFLALPESIRSKGLDRYYLSYILLIWIYVLKAKTIHLKKHADHTIEIVDDLDTFEVSRSDIVALCLDHMWRSRLIPYSDPYLSEEEQKEFENEINKEHIEDILSRLIIAYSFKNKESLSIQQKRMMELFLFKTGKKTGHFLVTSAYPPIPMEKSEPALTIEFSL